MARGKGGKKGAEKGADEYDFADNDLEEQLAGVGKKLKALATSAPGGKDALIKLLKVNYSSSIWCTSRWFGAHAVDKMMMPLCSCVLL